MSSSGAEQTTARYAAGRWVSAAPTSSPPLDPPMIDSWLVVVVPAETSASQAAWKSSNTFCLLARLPARCQASPSSPPPRSETTA